MNTKLLLQWLELPEGNWPPGHRALLGISADASIDANLVEQRALEQMEKLRPHQIVHPDLVTEGMTRLAQAMIALSETPVVHRTTSQTKSSASKPARPAPATQPSSPQPSLEATDRPILAPRRSTEKPDPAAELILDADRLSVPATRVTAAPSSSAPPAPVILDAEIVEVPRPAKPSASRMLIASAGLGSTVVEETGPVETGPVRAVALPVSLTSEAPEGLVYLPGDRRLAYQQIVAVRQVKEAWQELRPFLGNPSEPFVSPVKVLEFWRTVQKSRRALSRLQTLDFLESRQRSILSILEHPLALTLVREALPAQRKELAISWSLGCQLFEQHYDQLRRSLNASKPRNRLPHVLSSCLHWMRGNPEWWLGGIILLTWIIAWIRALSWKSS